jgi:NADH-quinone oxidoreductase subunit J
MNVAAFWILSGLAVAGAVVSVTRRNPLSSALALVVSLVAVAGLFATLSAHFLFAVQLLVYAGAVMVLVIYVIMILNLRERDMRGPRRFPASSVVLALLAWRPRSRRSPASSPAAARLLPDQGLAQSRRSPSALIHGIFFAFEVISVLLLAAMVGAVVLAMRKF